MLKHYFTSQKKQLKLKYDFWYALGQKVVSSPNLLNYGSSKAQSTNWGSGDRGQTPFEVLRPIKMMALLSLCLPFGNIICFQFSNNKFNQIIMNY